MYTGMPFLIEVTGDVAAVTTMDRQLIFAIADSLTKVAKLSQKEIPVELNKDFVIRGDWWQQNRKFGIKVKPARKTELEAAVYTAADWLLEAEGFHGGIKTPDNGGQNLAEPDVEHTRHGIRNKVARAEKARRLLADSKNRAFKIKGKYGGQLIYQRIGVDATGNPKVLKSGRYSTAKRQGQKTKLILKYILRPTVEVPYHPVITRTTEIVVRLHYSDLLNQSFVAAMRSAKSR